MKINTLLNRAVFAELIPLFLLNVIFLTFIFLMSAMLEITNSGIGNGVPFSVIFALIFFNMPYFLQFVIPMSVMMAVLLTFLRMSTDNEIIALKAGGVNIFSLLPPVIIFCTIGCLLSGFMAIYALPWGRMEMRSLTQKISSIDLTSIIKERTFFDQFKGMMLYVDGIETKGKGHLLLTDIFIEDNNSPESTMAIVAQHGELLSDPSTQVYQMRLFDGAVHILDKNGKPQGATHFDQLNESLDLKAAISTAKGSPKKPDEMSLTELKQHIFELEQHIRKDPKRAAKYYSALMKWHGRFSIPISCFVLGLLAFPLGFQSMVARKSFGLLLGLGFFLFYYLLLTVAWAFGESGVYPPIIGMWLPNVVTGVITVYLFIRTAKDQPIRLDILATRIRSISQRILVKVN